MCVIGEQAPSPEEYCIFHSVLIAPDQIISRVPSLGFFLPSLSKSNYGSSKWINSFWITVGSSLEHSTDQALGYKHVRPAIQEADAGRQKKINVFLSYRGDLKKPRQLRPRIKRRKYKTGAGKIDHRLNTWLAQVKHQI